MTTVVFALSLVFGLMQSPAKTKGTPKNAPVAVEAKPTEEARIDPEIADKLLKVKRIYVDSFGDDALSKSLQGMVINALTASKRFIVTENKEKADAVLKGGALEKTSQEFHSLGEGAHVATASGGQSSSITGNAAGVSGSSHGGFIARAMGAEDSVASTETVNDARLAVRLVAADGDVIWTTTQESKGAKYKGATADVADKMVKQLLRDLEKLQKPEGVK